MQVQVADGGAIALTLERAAWFRFSLSDDVDMGVNGRFSSTYAMRLIGDSFRVYSLPSAQGQLG